METLIIDIPEQKSALVKELLKELGVGIRATDVGHTEESIENEIDKSAEERLSKIIAEARSKKPILPVGKKTSIDKILSHFGENPDFPSIEEIRAKAWPKKW